jgi:quercetin dioxygenase-like cupin family protein
LASFIIGFAIGPFSAKTDWLTSAASQREGEFSIMTDCNNWEFIHHSAESATWTPGLRKIFDYRDLGIKDGTNGDFVAHVIRRNQTESADGVQSWHVHDCNFQLVYVLNGWATFEYEGEGERTIRKGDTVLQVPMIKHREIACSDDFEVLEIVSPADFATRLVEPPA